MNRRPILVRGSRRVMCGTQGFYIINHYYRLTHTACTLMYSCPRRRLLALVEKANSKLCDFRKSRGFPVKPLSDCFLAGIFRGETCGVISWYVQMEARPCWERCMEGLHQGLPCSQHWLFWLLHQHGDQALWNSGQMVWKGFPFPLSCAYIHPWGFPEVCHSVAFSHVFMSHCWGKWWTHTQPVLSGKMREILLKLRSANLAWLDPCPAARTQTSPC